MASISHDKKAGTRIIQFVAGDDRRRSIRLGKVSQRIAEAIKVRIEQLNAAVITGHSVEADTARWLTTIDKRLADKLAAVGLIPERKVARLQEFIDGYLITRTDIKPRTRINLEQSRRWLIQFFGADRRLADITAGDADEFRRWLFENTARRHCGRAKQYFRAALRKRLMEANPFGDMKGCSVKANRSRDYFVTLDDAKKVLEACPDAQWRLLFALSRYGGLRCPSEHLALTWNDVDWDGNRITIHSPKTEHHEGKESRVVPIFPELRPYLNDAWELAEDGATHVVTIPSIRRNGDANLRTRMEKIIARAGLKPWPKLFHNLRATRETELAQQYPMHVVCEWIGNSQPVALKHYLRVTDGDYATATAQPTATPAKVESTAAASGAESGAVIGQTAVQKMVQQSSAAICTVGQETQTARELRADSRSIPTLCELLQNYLIPRRGLEPPT
jgi:integrase